MIIPFKELEPDRGGLDTGLLTIARNCYPTTIGYGPMPTLSEYGSSALPSRCKGLFFARGVSGGYQVFACTNTKIYKLVAGVWTDYSRVSGGAYTTAAANYWQGAQWGSLLILVNGSDAPQVIDVDGGAVNFANLAGSPPVAVYISVVGDFVFLVDATNRRRLIHCGTTGPNTATSWTIGTDLCDEYVAPDGGNISCAPMMGEYGLFLQDGGVARRLVLQRGDLDTAYVYEKIEGIKGAIGGYSTVVANGRIFYLAEDGIYSLGQDGSNTPVGSQRIDREFRNRSDQARLEQVQGFADPFSTRIYWAYYSTPSATSFDRLLGYDWLLDRVFFVEATAGFWAGIVVPGMTLEQVGATYPNIELMPVTLDSRQFIGGRPTLAAVNESGNLAILSGPNATATLRVAEMHLVQGQRAFLDEVEPIGIWNSEASLNLRVGRREHTGAYPTWTGDLFPSKRTGKFYPRASGRTFILEMTIAGGGWEHAQGLLTREKPDGDQ